MTLYIINVVRENGLNVILMSTSKVLLYCSSLSIEIVDISVAFGVRVSYDSSTHTEWKVETQRPGNVSVSVVLFTSHQSFSIEIGL